jgi:hypothetical protein
LGSFAPKSGGSAPADFGRAAAAIGLELGSFAPGVEAVWES